MGVIRLARAVADPEEVARGRVVIAAGRIDAHERLLVGKQQRLVARIEIGRPEPLGTLGGDAARAHEVQRLGDAVRQFLDAGAGGAIGDEAQRPLMHPLQVRVAALGEGAEQIERGRRLPVGLAHPVRIGDTRLGREGDVVDDVAAIARQLDAIPFSMSAERGLANWPAMRPILTTGLLAAKVSTTAICRNTRKKSRIGSAPCSEKVSAQSPPWSMKARPAATSPKAFRSARASPAKTSGGKLASSFSTTRRAASSG